MDRTTMSRCVGRYHVTRNEAKYLTILCVFAVIFSSVFDV